MEENFCTLNSGNSDRKKRRLQGVSPGCCIHCMHAYGGIFEKGGPVVLTLLLLLCNIYVDSHVMEMEIMLVFYSGICLQDY